MLLSTRPLTHSVRLTQRPTTNLYQGQKTQSSRHKAASARKDAMDSTSAASKLFRQLEEDSSKRGKQATQMMRDGLMELRAKADRKNWDKDADELFGQVQEWMNKDSPARAKQLLKDLEALEEEEKEGKQEKKEKKEKKKETKAEAQKEENDKQQLKKEEPESKALKAERKRLMKEAEARGALYALHWVVAPKKVAQEAEAACNTMVAATATGVAGDPTAPAKQFISSLQMDLKRMEKVAKDAVWYLTREAEDGLHVVLVTANAKHASKHELAELTGAADTHVLSLGAAGEVEVPVATLRSLVLAQREESSDSESEGEEEKLRKGDSKDSKTSMLGQLGGIHVEGDVDAAIAAALASIGATGESNELDPDAGTQYPPFRSFL